MSQKVALVNALKKALKQNGKTYEDVAIALDLSHGSVKRLFSQCDFSLERLDILCKLLDMEISDLVIQMQQAQQKTETLTLEQEKDLVANTKLMLTAHLLVNGWKPEEILSTYQIDEHEMTQNLAKLDRIKIIDLHPMNRVKLRISRNFQWLKNGPIESFFKQHVQSDFFSSEFNGNGEIRMVVSGMLSRSSNAELMRRIKRLAKAFDEMHQEDTAYDISERYGTSLVLAMRPWDLPLFNQLRRNRNNKVF